MAVLDGASVGLVVCEYYIIPVKSGLPLADGQRVRVVVLTDGEAIEERVAAMHAAADGWLAQQPPNAVPAIPDYSPEEWAKLDAEWEELLAEIEQRAKQHAEAEFAADVAEAVRAARKRRRDQKTRQVSSQPAKSNGPQQRRSRRRK